MKRIVMGVVLVAAFGGGLAIGLAARDDGPAKPKPEQPGRIAASAIDWSNPAELPPPKHEDYRSTFVSEEEGFRFHPRSGRVEPVLAYRFDTGHCGLSFLADFDGSFWQPVDAGDGEAPDLLINQDVGAIALVDRDLAIYRSSSGVEITLERIDGPVVTQPCE